MAPQLAVEVLSPSTRRVDLTLKLSRYEAAGCPSYWVVDPDGPSLTAWQLVEGGTSRSPTSRVTRRSPPRSRTRSSSYRLGCARDTVEDETERLSRELALATGESITAAITVAVRERLTRLRAEDGTDVAARRERIRQIAADAAGRWPVELRHVEHGDLLYDEQGLPQ